MTLLFNPDFDFVMWSALISLGSIAFLYLFDLWSIITDPTIDRKPSVKFGVFVTIVAIYGAVGLTVGGGPVAGEVNIRLNSTNDAPKAEFVEALDKSAVTARTIEQIAADRVTDKSRENDKKDVESKKRERKGNDSMKSFRDGILKRDTKKSEK